MNIEFLDSANHANPANFNLFHKKIVHTITIRLLTVLSIFEPTEKLMYCSIKSNQQQNIVS